MPELPEVQTTVNGLNKVLKGKKITAIWSAYNSPHYKGKENIKDKKYFLRFRKNTLNSPVLGTDRVGKNILIHLKNGVTVLIHMKMTGHLLYGKYEKRKEEWEASEKGPLQDPFNKHIRLVFELNNGKHVVLSDMRKFAKVMYIKTKDLERHSDLLSVAPDSFKLSQNEFVKRLRNKKSGKIKSILMDQALVSGIGNIYSDEILFETNIHPETDIDAVDNKKLEEIWRVSRKILERGINLGGDSMSDYRNIKGEKGKFQNKHKVYRKTGERCLKKNCPGKIKRKVIGGRSAHFCNRHQKLIKTKKRK